MPPYSNPGGIVTKYCVRYESSPLFSTVTLRVRVWSVVPTTNFSVALEFFSYSEKTKWWQTVLLWFADREHKYCRHRNSFQWSTECNIRVKVSFKLKANLALKCHRHGCVDSGLQFGATSFHIAVICRKDYGRYFVANCILKVLYIYIQFWCESVPYLNKDYGDINIERFTVLPILCELHNLLDFVRLFTRHRWRQNLHSPLFILNVKIFIK